MRPGDVLELESRITRVRGSFAFVDAEARVDGKVACSATLTLALGSADQGVSAMASPKEHLELEDKFASVYNKFKLHFYQETFARFQNREASLTTVEAFAMEAIYALGSPTVQ